MSEKSKKIIFMGNTSNHISFTDMETGRTWTFGAANTNYENIRKWIIDEFLVRTPMYAGQEIEIIGDMVHVPKCIEDICGPNRAFVYRSFDSAVNKNGDKLIVVASPLFPPAECFRIDSEYFAQKMRAMYYIYNHYYNKTF